MTAPGEPLILPTAYRHRAGTDMDMLHALRNHTHQSAVLDDGMAMYVGPAMDGELIEVGVVEWYGEIAVVHCMRPARERYLR